MDLHTTFGQDVKNLLAQYFRCRAIITETDIADWIFMNAMEHSIIYIAQSGFAKINWADREDVGDITDITSYKELTGFLTFETMLPATDAHNMIVKSIRLDPYEMIETGAGREDFEQVLGTAASFAKKFMEGGDTNVTPNDQ